MLSLTENAVVSYTVEAEVSPDRWATTIRSCGPTALFPCKDGHVFFGGYTQKLWAESCRIFGQPELLEDPEIATMEQRFDEATYQRRVKPIVEAWFAGAHQGRARGDGRRPDPAERGQGHRRGRRRPAHRASAT